MSDDLKKEIGAREEEIITLRRDFHQHPELGLKEIRTSRRIADYLEKDGIGGYHRSGANRCDRFASGCQTRQNINDAGGYGRPSHPGKKPGLLTGLKMTASCMPAAMMVIWPFYWRRQKY